MRGMQEAHINTLLKVVPPRPVVVVLRTIFTAPPNGQAHHRRIVPWAVRISTGHYVSVTLSEYHKFEHSRATVSVEPQAVP